MPDFDPNQINIDELVADRKKFNAFVYTPVEKAVAELKKRREDKLLEEKVNALLGGDIPAPFLDGPRGVLFRQLATPNYEVRRFLTITDGVDLRTIFFEYFDDKFTSNNELKYFLGRIGFHSGFNKNKEAILKFKTIVDFSKFDGKKIYEVKTLWGQSLVDFHHGLFEKTYKPVIKNNDFYDASAWLKKHSQNAKEYYKPFLMLLVRNAILFENFMLDAKEISFTKDIFLPAFIEVFSKTGLKPLIVALEPTNIEGDRFWMSYPEASKIHFEKEMESAP